MHYYFKRRYNFKSQARCLGLNVLRSKPPVLNWVHVLIAGRMLSKKEDGMEASRPTKVANVKAVTDQRGLSLSGVI